MDKLIEMIKSWPQLGQGLFLFSVVFIIAVVISDIFKYTAIAIRGWPNKRSKE